MTSSDILKRLTDVIRARREADPETSYVARLYNKGRRKIAQKVGEEGVEVALAATEGSQEDVIAESADLLFHLMVLWADMDIRPEQIYTELARREGLSGIEEEKSRAASKPASE